VNVKAWVLGAAVAVALGAAPATAQAQAASSRTTGWSFEFTPYLWGAAMSGSVGVGSLEDVAVDMSFSDILDNLDAGEFHQQHGGRGHGDQRAAAGLPPPARGRT
jgi:hypothetical protein